MNTVSVAGNLTRDPELHYTPNGQPTAKFGLAANRSYINRAGEKVDQVDFFNVNTWGTLAENVAESLQKGSHVLVSGRLQSRSFESEDGSKHTAVEIQAEEVAASLRWATVQAGPSARQVARALDAEIVQDDPTVPAQGPPQPTSGAAPGQAPGPEQVANLTAASFPAAASSITPGASSALAAPTPRPAPTMPSAIQPGIER